MDFAGERGAVVVAGKALVLALVVLRPPPAVEVDDQRPRPPPHRYLGVLGHVEELPVPRPGEAVRKRERFAQ